MFIYGVITVILLLAAGIESHPGPQVEDQLVYLIDQLTKLNEKIVVGFASNTVYLNTLRAEFRAHNEIQQNCYEQLQDKIAALTKEISALNIKMQCKDKIKRKNNIIVHGIFESDNDERNCIDIARDICLTFNVEIEAGDISNAFRIGPKKGKRPLLITLCCFIKKKQILQEYGKCNDKSFKITNDLSQEERKLKLELQPHCNEAIKNGHCAFIRNGKLIVNGKTIRKEDLPPLTKNNAMRPHNHADQSTGGPSTEAHRFSRHITRQTRGDTHYQPQSTSFSSTQETPSNIASMDPRFATTVGNRVTSLHPSVPPPSKPNKSTSSGDRCTLTSLDDMQVEYPAPQTYAETVSVKVNKKCNNVVVASEPSKINKFKQTIRILKLEHKNQ
jgi:hypothetical protein